MESGKEKEEVSHIKSSLKPIVFPPISAHTGPLPTLFNIKKDTGIPKSKPCSGVFLYKSNEIKEMETWEGTRYVEDQCTV